MHHVKSAFFKCFIFLSLAFIMTIGSGCVAGQSIRLVHSPSQAIMTDPGTDVLVSVKDERPYVKSGNKRPDYLGHYRAGFGNTWAVKNAEDVSLEQQFQSDLKRELESLGFGTRDSSKRQLLVRILEFNFDAMLNGKFWYEIKVEVVDSGKTLAENTVKDNNLIRGNVWVGAKYAFEREVPEIYSSLIRKIVRENAVILAALKS